MNKAKTSEEKDNYGVVLKVSPVFWSKLQVVYFSKKKKKRPGGCFPGGSVVKNPPANAGDRGSIRDPGKSHMPQSN